MKKRTKMIIGISLAAIMLFYIFAIGSIFFSGSKSSGGLGDVVAVISLSGSIADGNGESDPFGSAAGITPSLVRDQLKEALEDSSVKAIVLKVNSPGGSVGASQEIAEEIKRAKDEKPIVVFMGDMAASGGYYISAMASKIVAKPGTLVGSIGVISQFMDLSGLYEKLGIKVQTIKSGIHKDMGVRTLTEEEVAKWQGLSDEVYNQFIGDVATGRGLKVDEVRSAATGELFTGSRAKDLGLIDYVGDYQKAIDVAAELAGVEDPSVVEYEGPTFLDALFGLSASDLDFFIKAKALGPEYAILDKLKQEAAMPRYQTKR
ncbi:MAG: signal peptide peptidase SppA [Actinomycetota bacterium]|nr:signal peptide peptidase SppA [Actinomycetota bacterium]